jgi:2-hydroxycyclohexanecarboxyl-CoA dehydrogenase
MRFKDKVAVITGGTAGMGLEATLGFAREGAAVVINDINEESLSATIEKIEAMGGKATAAPGDITKRETIDGMVKAALDNYGRLDILFNYVGGEPGGAALTPFIEQSEDRWDKMIELNLKSTIMTCRAVLDPMMEQKYGKIINTGAIAGKIGGPCMALYSAVKGGIIAFTKALAIEMAPYKINVNSVCPGPTETPGMKTVLENAPEQAAAITALKRIGKAEEVASAVLYLASDEAAFITGETLRVDGGIVVGT